MTAKTLYEKIWNNHVVYEEPGKPSLLYIDRHLIHEGTSPQAFSGLRAEGRKVRRPTVRHEQQESGDRAHYRPRAWYYAARPDDCLRRQPHFHARSIWHARFRNW